MEGNNQLPLETIDLSNKGDGGERRYPSLAFMQQASSESYNGSGGMSSPSANAASIPVVSAIEGTEKQATRPRARSSLSIKEWSSHQLKITKQLVQERFGHGLRTVDADLEHRIENLKDTQKKYTQLVTLTVQFQTHFLSMVDAQKSLAEHFAFLSVRAPELNTEFQFNSETQKVISRNGETLLDALKYFVANLQTIITKTMDDTLQTAKGYDSSRLAYDAYRVECENLQKQAATSQKAASSLAIASVELDKCKKKFEKLREDVDIKLKLLDENKVRDVVCHMVSYCNNMC